MKLNIPPYKHKEHLNPRCPWCSDHTTWLSKDRPEPQQLKFWDEKLEMWFADGFACVASPFCKGLYPDESIWKQRKEYMEAIIKSNKEQEERQKFGSQLLGGPIGSSMPRL